MSHERSATVSPTVRHGTESVGERSNSNKMNEFVSITKLTSPSHNRNSPSPINSNANEVGFKTGFNVDDQYFSTVAYANVDSGAIETNSTDVQQKIFSTTNVTESLTASNAFATDAQGLYKDPNPEVVRRPAPSSPQTYTQRVMVRFLQPPPLPPPGPLIIKEVRPPQPPPPPPLYIRQRPPPIPPLPPLVIREAPPKLPPPVGPQIITKVLPSIPVPPRSVIIERLPPLPPKPRDIIVERWLPYRIEQKRRVIIQRAPPPPIQKPRNIIIYYEQPKAQVVRRFQNLGIQPANPSEYVARYGSQLEDAEALITQARRAGVIEDINPPSNWTVGNANLTKAESYETGSFNATSENSDGVHASVNGVDITDAFSTAGNTEYDIVGSTGIGAGASSSYQSFSTYMNGTDLSNYAQNFEGSLANFGLINNQPGGTSTSSTYESFSTQQNFGF